VVLHNIGNAVTPAKVHLDALKRLQDERIYQYLKKCYQELQRHKDDLTAYVTHDSRGREVFAYMASLIDAFKDQMNRQSEIWERIDTALSYVSEILTLEQTYDPNAGNRTETVDLNRMMEDALHMQAESIRRRDITVFKNLAPGTVNLKLDKSRLMQTIVNLIRNSCEALDASGGAAKKQMRIATFQDNRTAGFVVEDTGVGLAQAEAASFFDFGVSGRGGSGFGLTYSREFVESNGGRIHLTSPGPGKGASVRVEFPKPRAEAA
jgi:signal transduction histidine kinase